MTEEKVRQENTQHPDKANNKKCYVFNTFQIYSFSRNELLQWLTCSWCEYVLKNYELFS